MTSESKNGMMAIRKSIALTSQALDLVDAHGGPPEAAVHLQLALQILREFVAGRAESGDQSSM